MRKIVLLILLTISSLVGIEKNSMDCSDTPDWLMSEADKKYLCKENDSSKETHIAQKWLKVSSTLCADNDGKNDNGQCEATWEDAQKMCKALDARLPTIEELSIACPSNTKNQDENIKDLKYQKCYKSQGFSAENYYWSSTVDEVDPGKILAYYFYVGRKMAYKQNYGFYVRCLKSKVTKKSVSKKKKLSEKSYLSMPSDATGTLIGKYFFDRVGDNDKVYLYEIKEIMEKEGKVNGDQNDIGTPIYFAAAKGHYEIVKYLIEKGANINLMYETSGTPLHSASAYGHYNIVKLLMDNGADTSLKNPFGKTAVRLASNEKIINLLEGFLEASDNQKDKLTGIVYGLDPNGDGFLSIRTKPKGREIGKLYNGDKVKILSKKGKYYKIEKAGSGMVGYAHSNWIRKTSSTSSTNTSTTSSNKVGVVQGLDPNGDGFLALRAKYKTGRQIGKLYEGDKVKILAKRGKWYKVKTLSAGQVGWAHGGWVRVSSRKKKSKKEIQKAHELEMLAMIKDTPKNIKLWSIQDKKNKKLVLQAAKINGIILKYIDIDDYKKDKDIALEAVKSQYRTVPEYLDNMLLKDRNFVMASVKYLPNILKYVDSKLKKNDAIVFLAMSNDYSSLQYVDKKYQKDSRILKYIKVKPAIEVSNNLKYAVGKVYYPVCIGCHGLEGEKKALGKSQEIKNLSKKKVFDKLKKYQKGYNQYGLGGMMKGYVSNLSDYELESLSIYIANFKNNASEVFIKEKQTISKPTSINNSTKNRKWLTPSKTICEKNGGKIDDNGYCTSNWTNAKQICNAAYGELPNIKELESVVMDCGGVYAKWNDNTKDSISKKNKANNSYKACYQKLGFKSTFYWSTITRTVDNDSALVVNFNKGTEGYSSKGGSYYQPNVVCVEKPHKRDKKYENTQGNPNKHSYVDDHSIDMDNWIIISKNHCGDDIGWGGFENNVCFAEYNYAHEICHNVGGRLPSIDELEHEAKTICGLKLDMSTKQRKQIIKTKEYKMCLSANNYFSNKLYWSSTEHDKETVYGVRFSSSRVKKLIVDKYDTDLNEYHAQAVSCIKDKQYIAKKVTPKHPYLKCKSCHGEHGEKMALGKSKIIKNMSKIEILQALKGYNNNTYGGALGGIMKVYSSKLTEEDMEAIVDYLKIK